MDRMVCAWCLRDFSGYSDAFLASVEYNSGGIIRCFQMERFDRTFSAITPTLDSATRKCGMEFMFELCSMKCGDLLLAAIWKDAKITGVNKIN